MQMNQIGEMPIKAKVAIVLACGIVAFIILFPSFSATQIISDSGSETFIESDEKGEGENVFEEPLEYFESSRGVESHYVDSFSEGSTDWTTSGSLPYLANDTDYIYTGMDGAENSWFGFENLNYSSSSISTVKLFVETQQETGGDEEILFSIEATGVSDQVVLTDTPSSAGYTLNSQVITSILDTDTKINSAVLKAVSNKVGSGAMSTVYIRKAYLEVDYEPVIPSDSCSCPATGHWSIKNGDICTLANVCNLSGGDLHIDNGSLNISKTGTLVIPSGYQVTVDKGSFLYREDGGILVNHK